jgi:hypothetical protein
MIAPHNLIPMALLALATLVAVGIIVALGELLRRAVLALLSALVPERPGGERASIPGSPPNGEPPGERGRGALPG